jgi:hypothetical protein
MVGSVPPVVSLENDTPVFWAEGFLGVNLSIDRKLELLLSLVPLTELIGPWWVRSCTILIKLYEITLCLEDGWGMMKVRLKRTTEIPVALRLHSGP